MIPILAVLQKDGYKVGHKFQYPADTTLVYSNMTPRQSRVPGSNGMMAFGMQYLVLEYLQRQFDQTFFGVPKDDVMREYKRVIGAYLGPLPSYDHIEALWELQHLPLLVKAVPEGTIVPLRVPFLTIRNTKPEFFWLTNMLETLISNVLWMPCTSATTAFRYRVNFERAARATGGDRDFVRWQGHDFSYRGLAGLEAACLSGAAHLLSFYGTDTIPALLWLERFYRARIGDGVPVGGSVPATEHSVMSMGTMVDEAETIHRLITEVYPKGIVSIVSDTWDFWEVINNFARELKPDIMARDGKVVFRPDSGDPVKILCGDPWEEEDARVRKGAIEILWEIFGGTVNEQGFKVLDPHVGVIYGDSITLDRQQQILKLLAEKKFVSTTPVLGIGSYTYQYVTRDTYGLAIKATYGETKRGPQAIYKDPKTDDGVKKSATGLLCLAEEEGKINCIENASWDLEGMGLLQPIFKNGVPMNRTSLFEIRARVDAAVKREMGEAK